MSNAKKSKVQEKKSNNVKFIAVGVIAVVAIGLAANFGLGGGKGSANNTPVTNGGNLTITKANITEKATFFPYQAGNTKMEVVAVKAPDGTIRTAFNTCQVCFDSGKGYYVQEGDELVCQNCGNRFKISDVEIVKGGCNPVPIFKENKQEDATNIVLAADFMSQNTSLFAKWKK